MRPAIRRELDALRRAHAHEPRLGCSTVAHKHLGYCGDCAGVGHRAECMGWQLLAMAADEEYAVAHP